jgi:hypothetical protein
MNSLQASLDDVAAAARLVSAISAEDQPGWAAVIAEVRSAGRMEGVALALAVRHIEVCAEYYDTDRQKFLDGFAFDACGKANRARGDRDTDDD